MKDLTHLYYLETLLEDANNDLVRKAIEDGRKEYVAKISKEYGAVGIIYEQMKFCDPWAYERVTGAYVLREEYGWPVLTIDRPYAVGSSGQLHTRVQAFVESIEIKKLSLL